MKGKKVEVSVLNLIPRFAGDSVLDAVNRAKQLAKDVEEMGYFRYMVGEHHNIKFLACSPTTLVMQSILDCTSKLRVGSGGVMLPNHTNLQLAEEFGYLYSVYGDRIDLGVGRASGTDALTRDLIYRQEIADIRGYEIAVKELLQYTGPTANQDQVQAYSAVNSNIPIVILGGSMSSAQVAGKLGLPYMFAGHFSASNMAEVAREYRSTFKPSAYLDEPYFGVGGMAILAETNEKAKQLFEDMHKTLVKAATEKAEVYPKRLPADPSFISSAERLFTGAMGLTLVGDEAKVSEEWQNIVDNVQPDELIISTPLKNQEELKTSYQLLQRVVQG